MDNVFSYIVTNLCRIYEFVQVKRWQNNTEYWHRCKICSFQCLLPLIQLSCAIKS